MEYSKAGAYVSDEITECQPFPTYVCGSKEFRIPGIITLKNGKLFAVADARWNDAGHDYGGIDTIYAISDDNGQTWRHGYAAMFPDTDGTPSDPHDATTCIDPCAVQDINGTIHVLVNMNPTGITTGLGWPGTGNGFAVIDGVSRLALTSDFSEACTDFFSSAANLYYVGEHRDGFAPVMNSDGTETAYSIDSYFNLYRNAEPVFQKQADTGKKIQQNIFYRDSDFHVFNTMYTLHLSTNDEGRTWNTEIISDRIKLQSEDALISSPGNGAVAPDGTLLMPFYTFDDREYAGFPLIVYSEDCGQTWKRTPVLGKAENIKYSGESKIIPLSENLWRVFVRNQNNRICYADYNKETDSWSVTVKTDISIHSDCNLGAVMHNGRIYVSCPAGTGPDCKNRCNGKLYEFSAGTDNAPVFERELKITEKAFSYSCLTSVGKDILVLYDTCEEGNIILSSITAD